MTGRKTAFSREKSDFIYLMSLFRNGTATRKDAELLWFILMEDEEDARAEGIAIGIKTARDALNPGVSGEGDS